LTFSSCNFVKIKIKNQEWCADKGKLGAVCFNTLNSNSRTITKKDWDAQSFGRLSTDAQTFADIKATLINLCKTTKRCSYEVEQLVLNFTNQVEKHTNKGVKK